MRFFVKYLRHLEDGKALVNQMLVHGETGVKSVVEVGLSALQRLDLLEDLLLYYNVFHVVSFLNHLFFRLLLNHLGVGRMLQAEGAKVKR